MTRRQMAGILAAGMAQGLARGAPSRKTRNVIFLMTDGLRWQDVFRGADPELMNRENGGVEDAVQVKKQFWRDTPGARREALLPFLWSVVARQGQIFGNRDLGSDAYVTNGMNFSYPGYNEALCGFGDPRINSNDKNLNPNTSVLEWLHRKPAYARKVAAFGAWDVFPYILNTQRSGLFVNAGYDPLEIGTKSPRIEMLNRLKQETGIWDSEALDAPMFLSALEYLKSAKPRVLFISLGDTDEWAHAGKYDLYLRAAHRFDQYAKELWETAQSLKEYRGATTLMLAVDHGRGGAPVEWKSHGQKIPDSKYVWMGFLGPETQPLGERSKTAAVTQSQLASTLAAFLGEDCLADLPHMAKPFDGVVGGSR